MLRHERYITLDSRKQQEAIEALAAVFVRESDADELLHRIDFPRAHRPLFTESPRAFWSNVVREVVAGRVAGGLPKLVSEACQLFPHNETIRSLAAFRKIPHRITTSMSPPDVYDVFLSHANADKPSMEALAHRLREDGLNPFLDKWDLVPGEPWQKALEDALAQSRTCAVVVGQGEMGPWHTREMRVALDQLAGNPSFRVIPVLLPGARRPADDKLPSFLRQLTWVEFRAVPDDDEAYHRLVSGIRGEAPGPGPARPPSPYPSMPTPYGAFQVFPDLKVKALGVDWLSPIDFGADIDNYVRGFSGRRWVLDRIDAWLKDVAASKAFFLTGDAGVGKSALAARLCQRHERVVAWHFCVYGDTTKSDALKCVRSLAYQLSSQLPDYRQRLLGVRLDEKANALTAFDQLIVQPLRGLGNPYFPFLVVVDALDEATRNGENEIADFLAQAFRLTPPWLRFVVTSRPEKLILRKKLGVLRPWVLDRAAPENREDLHRFLVRELSRITKAPASEPQVEAILDRSEGVFLYVVLVLEEIYKGRLSFDRLDDFPQGLHAIYGKFFDRYFSDNDPDRRARKEADYDKYQRPLLELVAAAQEPLLPGLIADLLGWDTYDRKRAIDPFGSLLKTRDERIVPSHFSIIEWLTHEDTELRYFIDAAKGHARFADAGWVKFKADPAAMDAYLGNYLPSHLLASGERRKLLEFLSDIEVFVTYFREDMYRYIGYWNVLSQQEEKGQRAFGDCVERLIENMAIWESSSQKAGRDREIYWSLGRLFFELQHERSIEVFKKALSCLPPDSDDDAIRARLCNDIGEAIFRLDQSADAEPYYREALSIRRRSPENKADLAESMNNYGHVFFHEGSYDRALEQYQLALEVWRTVPEGPHYGVADCLNNVATALADLGRKDEAMTSYEECSGILDSLDYFNWGIPIIRRNYGDLLAKTGELDEAERQYRLALEACKERYGDDHLSTIQSAKKIAMLSSHRGEPEKAIAELKVVAEACEHWYGRFHPKTIHTYNQFGEWLMGEERMSEARELLADMVTRIGKSETRDREIDAQALHDMGACCFYLGEYEDALEHLLKAYSMREELYSPGHEYILRTFRFILQACLRDEQLEEAAKFALEYHSKHVEAMPVNESLYFESQAMLAKTLRICEKWDSAEGIYREIITDGETVMRALDADEISKDSRAFNLAVAYNEIAFHWHVPQERWRQAEDFYRRAIDLMSTQENEVEAANMRLNLFTVLWKSGAAVDLDAVEKEIRTLEAKKDPRAEKGRTILEGTTG